MSDEELEGERQRHMIRWSLGRHKGRVERLTGLGLYELKQEDKVIEASRQKGWREADADPFKYAVEDELHAFNKFMEMTRKEFQ